MLPPNQILDYLSQSGVPRLAQGINTQLKKLPIMGKTIGAAEGLGRSIGRGIAGQGQAIADSPIIPMPDSRRQRTNYDSPRNAARKVTKLVRTFNERYGGMPPLSTAYAIASNPNIREDAIDIMFPGWLYNEMQMFVDKSPYWKTIGTAARHFGHEMAQLPVTFATQMERVEEERVATGKFLRPGDEGYEQMPWLRREKKKESAAFWSRKAANMEEALKKSPIGPRADDNLFASQLGAGVGSIATSITLTLATKNPNAATALFALRRESEVYKQSRQLGNDIKTSLDLAAKAGGTEAFFEYVGLDLFMRPSRGMLGLAKRALIEGSQEASQELGGAYWDEKSGVERDNLARDVVMAAGLGAVLGGATHIPLSVIQSDANVNTIMAEHKLNEEQARKILKTAYDGGFLEAGELEALQAERDEMIDELATELSKESDSEKSWEDFRAQAQETLESESEEYNQIVDMIVEHGGIEEPLDFFALGKEKTPLSAEQPPQEPPGPPGEPPGPSEPGEPELPKYAINLNLETFDIPYQAKKFLLDVAKDNREMIWRAKRGRVSIASMEEKATKSRKTVEQMIEKGKRNEPFTDVEVKLAKRMIGASANYTMGLQEKAAETNSEIDEKRWTYALQRHMQIQAHLGAGISEVGRALRAAREAQSPQEILTNNLKKFQDLFGGPENIPPDVLEAFKRIDPSDPVQMSIFMAEVAPATWGEKIYEFWISGLVSALGSQARNLGSNILVIGNRTLERAGGAGIDLTRATFKGEQRERFFGEVPASMFGLLFGMPSGGSRALYAWRHEISKEGEARKTEYHKHAIKGRKGKIIRIPLRGLTAGDEFFKTIHYQSELYARAYRKAAMEGLTDTELLNRTKELIENPTEDMVEAGHTEALEQTFNQALGPGGKKIVTAINSFNVVGVKPGIWVFPFKRTPANIMKYGMQRTPLQAVRIAHKQLSGKQETLKGGELSDELAKLSVGAAIGATIFILALRGLITGYGPKDKKKRAALYRKGWVPYSIKIGNRYVGYGGLEPIGTVVGITADFAEMLGEMEDMSSSSIPSEIAFSIARNFTSKTFMRGLYDVINAVQDPERYAQQYTETFASTAVPNFVKSLARAYDPYIRQPGNTKESLMASIPYLSTFVTPKRDVWGEPVKRPGGWLQKIVSPVRISKRKKDKVDMELERIGVEVGYPSKTITDIKLSEEEYDRYIELSGKKAKRELEVLVESKDYQAMSDIEKSDKVEEVIRDARSYVRPQILIEEKPGGDTIVDLDRQYKAFKRKNPNISESVQLALNERYRDVVEDTLRNEIIPGSKGSVRDGWEDFFEMWSQKNALLEKNDIFYGSKYAKELRLKFRENLAAISEDNPGFAEEFARYPIEVWRK